VVLLPVMLTACGYGLDGMIVHDDLGVVEPPVEVVLEGATYAVALDDVTVIEPPGLATVFEELDTGTVLFHVVREEAKIIDLAIALGDTDGRQSECEPVHALPPADFSGNPWLEIHGAALPLSMGGHPVSLDYMGLTAFFSPDGEEWQSGTLSAVLDTRELAPLFKDGTDVCALVEGMEGVCEPCSDGAIACVDVELDNVVGHQVPIRFDPDLDTSGC
jgi:hypothetical protein